MIEVRLATESVRPNDDDDGPARPPTGQARLRDSILLDQLSGLLATPLDTHDALGHVARLLVPRIADLALIDVLADDGTPQRVAVEYAANPALAALLQESAADLRDETYATTLVVLRSGVPYLQETCDPAGFELFLASAQLTDSQRDLLRSLQPSSYLAVPLNCRGRCLGVLSLLYTELSGRRYDGRDQAWAQQLAGRIGAALAIAHLERSTQQACAQVARLELELQRGQALERAVVENTNAPIVVVDALGRMQNLNPVVEKLLGVPCVELLGRPFWHLVPAGEVAAVRATLDAIYADGCARAEACHWLSRAGSRRHIRWALTPLLGPDERVAYVVAVGDLAEDAARQAAISAAAECLSQLHTFMAALEGATTVEQIAETALEQARATLSAGAGVVMRCSADGLSLETVAAVGYPDETLDTCVPLSLPVPLVTAVLTGEPVVLESPEEALRAGYDRRAEHLQSGVGAWAAVPLKVAGQVIGVMELSFMAARLFGEDDRAFLLVLAAQCAQAIERRQLHGSQLRPECRLGQSLLLPVHGVSAVETLLSAREREVLELLAEGLSNREIAAKLGVGVVTVKTHVAHVREKLEVSGSARARVLAARAMLLGLAPTSSKKGWSNEETHPLDDAAWTAQAGFPVLNRPSEDGRRCRAR